MRTTAPLLILSLVAAHAVADERTLAPLAHALDSTPGCPAGPFIREVADRPPLLPSGAATTRLAEPFPMLAPESSSRARELEDWGRVPAERQLTLRIVLTRKNRDGTSHRGKGKP